VKENSRASRTHLRKEEVYDQPQSYRTYDKNNVEPVLDLGKRSWRTLQEQNCGQPLPRHADCDTHRSNLGRVDLTGVDVHVRIDQGREKWYIHEDEEDSQGKDGRAGAWNCGIAGEDAFASKGERTAGQANEERLCPTEALEWDRC